MTVLRREGDALSRAVLFYKRKSCQQFFPSTKLGNEMLYKAAMNPKQKGPKNPQKTKQTKPLKAGANNQNQPMALVENPNHNLACVPRGTRGSEVEWGEHAPSPDWEGQLLLLRGGGQVPAPPSPTSIVPACKPQTGRAFSTGQGGPGTTVKSGVWQAGGLLHPLLHFPPHPFGHAAAFRLVEMCPTEISHLQIGVDLSPAKRNPFLCSYRRLPAVLAVKVIFPAILSPPAGLSMP